MTKTKPGNLNPIDQTKLFNAQKVVVRTDFGADVAITKVETKRLMLQNKALQLHYVGDATFRLQETPKNVKAFPKDQIS